MLKIRLMNAAGQVLGDAEIEPNPVGSGQDLPDVATYAGLVYVLDPHAAFFQGAGVEAIYRHADAVTLTKVSAPAGEPARIEQTRTGARMDLAEGETPAADVAALAYAARGR